jgi:hypothetical protein
MFSKSHTKHFKGFGSGFTKLHSKLPLSSSFTKAVTKITLWELSDTRHNFSENIKIPESVSL